MELLQELWEGPCGQQHEGGEMGLETQAEYRAFEGQGGTLGLDPTSRCTGRSPMRRELQ